MRDPTGSSWRREAQPEHAANKLLDAAEEAFIEQGVSAVGMAEIAEVAGCSRGTLYRYFGSRHELHLAYVQREAMRIVRRVRSAITGLEDGPERSVEYVLQTLRAVRSNPGTAAWFEPGAAGIAARMSRASEVIETLAGAFGEPFGERGHADDEALLRTRWLVRVIVSLLTDPEEDPARERALVERFVAPALLYDGALPSPRT